MSELIHALGTAWPAVVVIVALIVVAVAIACECIENCLVSDDTEDRPKNPNLEAP